MKIVKKIINKLLHKGFKSDEYWDARYKNGGNSGAGSYSNLAAYKAGFINKFVLANSIQTVIEFGSGDGNQLKLANYNSYLGFDVSEEALFICRNKFFEDKSKVFKNVSDYVSQQADLSMSLDVIYHLVEDSVFESYMKKLFNASKKWVIIYSSNYDGSGSAHVRHRQFIDWIATNGHDFSLVVTEKNPFPYSDADPDHTSLADFYIFARK